MIAPSGPPGSPAPGFPRALVAALEAYAATGTGDVRRLVDVRPPRHRLRNGDYRAIFAPTGTGPAAAVEVEWIGDRQDAY